MRFGKFVIPSSHIFYRSTMSASFVNLRPIVPGHVLVIPERIVAKMEDLTEDEYIDLWKAVRITQWAVQRYFPDTTAFNVAVQDGRAAGQSVPHVHVHVLPRKDGDFDRNDQVYDELEAWAPRDGMKTVQKLNVPDDQDRVDRTPQIMAEEAMFYRTILESKLS